MTTFERVLIANRGEIAIRIAKAAAALGIESVGVYAPVDAASLHTRFTTQANELAATPDPVRAYLDIDSLIRIARQTHCDCVHPGYGFLSENSGFARSCAEAGIAFIGPSPDALALFGDKVRSRALARSLGVTTAKLAHRYALSMDGVDSVILGVKNRVELKECLDAEAEGSLNVELIRQIDELVGRR